MQEKLDQACRASACWSPGICGHTGPYIPMIITFYQNPLRSRECRDWGKAAVDDVFAVQARRPGFRSPASQKQLSMKTHICNSSIGKWKQENQELKVMAVCVSSGPALSQKWHSEARQGRKAQPHLAQPFFLYSVPFPFSFLFK